MSLIDLDTLLMGSLMWEGTEVPGGNPCLRGEANLI